MLGVRKPIHPTPNTLLAIFFSKGVSKRHMERALIILKPDAVQRGLIGPILTRLEQRGLKFAALKLTRIHEQLARRHYAIQEGKPSFDGRVEHIVSRPAVAARVSGKNPTGIRP